MTDLIGQVLSSFLMALGTTMGGALSGAAASLLVGGHPMDRLRFLSDELRYWGILVAVSGSFEPLRNLEAGLFSFQIKGLMRQILFLLVAMLGAHVAYLLLQQLAGRKA